MAREISSTDIGNLPDVVSLVEEVQRTHRPRLLRRGGEDVAVLTPLAPPTSSPRQARQRAHRQPSQTDREAFRAAAGSWKGLVDGEQLKRDIYESRRISTRPPVDL